MPRYSANICRRETQCRPHLLFRNVALEAAQPRRSVGSHPSRTTPSPRPVPTMKADMFVSGAELLPEGGP